MGGPTQSTQKAVVARSKGVVEVTSSFPVPSDIKPGYVLVKTAAVALNPTDYKHLDREPIPGALAGCDYAGTIEEIGPDVTKAWKVGDRIAGFCHGLVHPDTHDGSFAEYILAKADLGIRVPDKLSFEEAATLGVGITTLGQGLYQSLKLPLPAPSSKHTDTQPQDNRPYILIYGGSTATGTLAIQFATLSNYRVITTSSPASFPLCKSLGSTACYDYNDPDCGAKIRELTNNSLHHVFDTITTESSMAICAAAFSTTSPAENNMYSGLLAAARHAFPGKENMKLATYTMAYTARGEHLKMQGSSGAELPAKPEDLDFQKMFNESVVEGLLQEGRLKCHPVEVGERGLEGCGGGVGEVEGGQGEGGEAGL